MSKNLFITGTGTDVGKTYVTGLIVKKLRETGYRPAYYKAGMSGNLRRADGSLIPGDADFVRTLAGLEQPLETMCPYVYENAVSPHLAARLEGGPVELDVVKAGFDALAKTYDLVTMEGSGGILCPLREEPGRRLLLEDVIRAMHIPSVLVADAELGSINRVVLTWSYMKEKGLPLAGILFNRVPEGDDMAEDNMTMCRALTGLPILARIPEGADTLPMAAADLAALYQEV